VNTIRGLCMDAIETAGSGHLGTPLGIATVAYTLWQRFLRFDPADPIWPSRDRFVLSEGHASALLWALLHLAEVQAVDPGYEVLGRATVTLEDLKTFRQLGSRCPGHPEYRWTSGVGATTGPLGQGVATSVGRRWRASGWPPGTTGTASPCSISMSTPLASDGCMMEGISAEALIPARARPARLWGRLTGPLPLPQRFMALASVASPAGGAGISRARCGVVGGLWLADIRR
jgi:transketolase